MLGRDVLSDLNRTVRQSDGSKHHHHRPVERAILKYLKPESTHSPQAPGLIFGGQTVTLHPKRRESIYYQWYKNGQPITERRVSM